MSMTMQPRAPVTFVAGPALTPSADLLSWLEGPVKSASPRKRLRIPVVVSFEDEFRFGWGPIFLGTSPDGGDSAIHLSLDDTAMGVGLLDTLVDTVPKDQDSCVVLLEGYWGDLMSGMPDFDLPGEEGPKKHPFAVLSFEGLLDADAAAAASVQIEAPAP